MARRLLPLLLVLATIAAAAPAADAGTRALTGQQRWVLRNIAQDEKLAHDVYARLGRRFSSLVVMRRIARIESEHVAITVRVLRANGYANPVAGYAPGRFPWQRFVLAYGSWMQAGRVSPTAALAVGAHIEEEDIVDVRFARRRSAGSPAMRRTMGILLRGSRNHLRRYVWALRARGVDYLPLVLAQTEFDAIISSPLERTRD